MASRVGVCGRRPWKLCKVSIEQGDQGANLLCMREASYFVPAHTRPIVKDFCQDDLSDPRISAAATGKLAYPLWGCPRGSNASCWLSL